LFVFFGSTPIDDVTFARNRLRELAERVENWRRATAAIERRLRSLERSSRAKLIYELLRSCQCQTLRIACSAIAMVSLKHEGLAKLVRDRPANKPVFGAIVEVQLRPKKQKRFSWPLYAVGARASDARSWCWW
jgi:hypothetical protein